MCVNPSFKNRCISSWPHESILNLWCTQCVDMPTVIAILPNLFHIIADVQLSSLLFLNFGLNNIIVNRPVSESGRPTKRCIPAVQENSTVGRIPKCFFMATIVMGSVLRGILQTRPWFLWRLISHNEYIWSWGTVFGCSVFIWDSKLAASFAQGIEITILWSFCLELKKHNYCDFKIYIN